MKMNTFSSYVLLVICVGTAFAQFDGGSSSLNFNEEANRARLSPQQQGHILSDVQQHQHRFNLNQNVQPQFPVQQQPLASNQFISQQQLLQNHQLLLNHQPKVVIPSQPLLPTIQPAQAQFQPKSNALPQQQIQISRVPSYFPVKQNFQIDPVPLDPEVQKKLQDKQTIIAKHNQYVEKQYEKALKKAQTDHVDFTDKQKDIKKKLYTRLYRPPGTPLERYTLNQPRYLYPEEITLFQAAVKKYYEEHPTTTTTTTTTTTPPPTTETTLKDLSPSSQNIYKEIQQPKTQFLPTIIPTQKLKTIQSLEDLTQLQSQYKNRQIRKDDLLAQLRLAIGGNLEESFGKNETSREISLPNGQRVEIIKTTDPNLIPGATPLSSLNSIQDIIGTTTTVKPPKEYIEELTQGLPPGAKYEVLRHGEDGGLEQVQALPTNLPDQKKVTFVLLEEQADGSFKVQGVKGNGNKEKTGAEYDSILQKIKEGEIKLPVNVQKAGVAPKIEVASTVFSPAVTTTTTTFRSTPKYITSQRPSTTTERTTRTIKLSANLGVSSQTTRPTTTNRTPSPTFSTRSVSSTKVAYPQFPDDLVRQASSSSSHSQNSLYNSISSTYKPNPTTATYSSTTPVAKKEDDLTDILKKHSLYAMAKFLRQSGLDTILNETGPYTVFAPTDKAFRTLLVQLGGPEKAEEKFKENPRLLSGLLLHHVIPGAFNISSLQDEMTGVSLAGTQLRVNQYKMHDAEWNDVKVTTINGAKVLDDKQDIEIPQGVAHSVDRVMFPLPVGDLIQTLQSDRERRFTNFLRAVFTSGLVESLQGTKTFTFFAPTDKAFAELSPEDVTKTVTDRALAKELVMRHLTHGTLYTTGMRYYQVRDSLEADHQITLSKSSGKVKVNNANISTQNIPATNGVIHAIDVLL